MQKAKPDKTKNNKDKALFLIIPGAGLILMALIGILLSLGPGKEVGKTDSITFPPIEVNQPAPELSLTTLDGDQVSLADFHGDVVLLNNWATWCPPCRLEMPEFNAYYNNYKDQGFQVLAVEAGQPEQEVRAFVEDNQLDFLVLLDPENKSLEMFQNSSLPNSYVMDREGNLRLAWLGAINEATLEEYVTPLIKE